MHMPDISTLTVFGRPYIKDLVYPKYLKVAIAPLSIINFISIGLSSGIQVLTTCLRRNSVWKGMTSFTFAALPAKSLN